MKARIMGIDYGEKRIGIALSDELLMFANGHSTINCHRDPNPIKTIQNIIKENNVQTLVVGYPIETGGAVGEKAKTVDEWILKLKAVINLPIVKEDERYTSVQAKKSLIQRGMNKKKRRQKSQVDRIAACFILQAYLDNQKGVR